MGRHRVVKLRNGTELRWEAIKRAYREHAEGKGYSKARIKSDLEKKERAFDTLSHVASLHERGDSYRTIGKMLKISPGTIQDWLNGVRMPRDISLNLHDFRQNRQRKQVRLDRSKKHEIGYFLGVSKAGRLQRRHNARTGAIKLAVSVNNGEIANIVERSVTGLFGIDVVRPKPKKTYKSKNERHEVIVESANLNRLLKRTLDAGKGEMDYLPDHPEARLGFTRAMIDLGTTWIVGRPRQKSVIFWHEDPQVRKIVSRTLEERKVPHELSTHRGKPSIKIDRLGAIAFNRAIGFRSSEKEQRLLS